ncbi:MAG: hypothetical protein WDZ94_01210 [Patescibacteria group bacterium]
MQLLLKSLSLRPLQSLKLLCLVALTFLVQVPATNSYFSSDAAIVSNQIQTGNWIPEISFDESITATNGYSCGVGAAVAEDGLRIHVTNWHEGYQLEGRYYIEGSGVYGSWMNLLTMGDVELVGDQLTVTLHNTGNTPAGEASWQVRTLNQFGDELSGPAQLDYIITTDLESQACGGTLGVGFETSETGELSGIEQCQVTTADASQDGASKQVLKWHEIDFATSYRIQGYIWQDDNWQTYGGQYQLSTDPLSANVSVEDGIVRYETSASAEVTTAYFIEALDAQNTILAQSSPQSDEFSCTFTVDRSEPLPAPLLLSIDEEQEQSEMDVMITQEDQSLRIAFADAENIFDSVKVAISYDRDGHSEPLEEMIEDTITKDLDAATIEKLFYIGTCSSGGTCTPHTSVVHGQVHLLYKIGTNIEYDETLPFTWSEL